MKAGEMTVPRNPADRMSLWVRSSNRFVLPTVPFVTLAIQQLGHAERPLLAMEGDLARAHSESPEPSIERGLALMECSALSIYWTCGLYDMLRTLKQAEPARFKPLESLFHKVEVVRMPLAKHEVKSAPGYRDTSHFPTGLWWYEQGWVGWHVFDPSTKQMVALARTALADEFLSTTAFDAAD